MESYIGDLNMARFLKVLSTQEIGKRVIVDRSWGLTGTVGPWFLNIT